MLGDNVLTYTTYSATMFQLIRHARRPYFNRYDKRAHSNIYDILVVVVVVVATTTTTSYGDHHHHHPPPPLATRITTTFSPATTTLSVQKAVLFLGPFF